MTDKITNFKDLIAWQEAHALVLEIYEDIKLFPNEEKYALSSQLKRAVISTTSNIAEGFSRRTAKDKAHFYYVSLGSLTEAESQIEVAGDLGYISKAEILLLREKIMKVSKLVNGLIKSTQKK